MGIAQLRGWATAGLVLLASAILIAGCGSSSSSSKAGSGSGTSSSGQAGTATPLALTISEAGKTAKYSGPSSISGGLVTVALTNTGKAPHGAQLIRVIGNHSVVQALMAVGGGKSSKTPNWVHADGGVGLAAPGTTASATVALTPGKYAIADIAGAQGGPGGPPAFTALTVSGGAAATLPVSGTTITAAAPSKDHYKWELSGPLKTGANPVTFISKGHSTLHLMSAFRITGKHSNAELLKALQSNGAPPSYVDQSITVQTAALDGGKTLTTQLTFPKPGTYVLFCPLKDRDGGKPHFAEGLLTTTTVR